MEKFRTHLGESSDLIRYVIGLDPAISAFVPFGAELYKSLVPHIFRMI